VAGLIDDARRNADQPLGLKGLVDLTRCGLGRHDNKPPKRADRNFCRRRQESILSGARENGPGSSASAPSQDGAIESALPETAVGGGVGIGL